MAAKPTSTLNADIHSATAGFSALLNDDVDHAKEVFLSRPDSVFHAVGGALISFLEACLGQEEKDLSSSLDLLFKAEEAVKKAKHRAVSSHAEPGPSSPRWWPAGTEYDCLAAETLICQAIVHFLTESLVEMTKGIYKLGKAHKQFAAAYKHVFPATQQAVTGDPQHLVNTLNLLYASAALEGSHPSRHLPNHHHHVPGTPSSWLSRIASGPSRSHSAHITVGVAKPLGANGIRTAPTSVDTTPDEKIPGGKTAWQNDDLTLLVVGATAFGNAVFGLILSVLPSKARRLLGWVGFSGVLNRRESVRMLNLAATTCSAETHGLLSGLALLSYFFVVILANGWQADEKFIFDSYETVVSNFSRLLPNSSACALHRSRLHRIRGDATTARKLLLAWQASREEPSSPASDLRADDAPSAEGHGKRSLGMRQVDGLIWHEVSHLNVTLGLWKEAAEAFMECQARSSWSHVTTTFAAVGCWMMIPERSPELDKQIAKSFAELPKLMKQRRLFGEPPPMETYISRKLLQYKAKHDQMCAAGLVKAGREACFWDSIVVAPIEEFAILWSMYGRAPRESLEANVARLAAHSPVIDVSALQHRTSTSSIRTLGSSSSSPISPVSASTVSSSMSRMSLDGPAPGKTDLFLPDELAVRDVLVGVQLSALGRYRAARSLLKGVADAEAAVHGDTYIIAHALAELAVIELKEGDEIAAARPDQAEEEVQKFWKERMAEAAKWIDAAFSRGAEHYNMRSRLEFKLGLLKEEIADRKMILGIK